MTVAWQARICDAYDRVLGAGFLLAGRRILTCAHVVAAAVRPLRVYFPAQPDVDAVEVTVVDSESWYGSEDRRGDVALLHLPAGPPLPEPASLEPVDCAVGMQVRAHGYPARYEREGRWAVATVVGPGGPGHEWYEIHGGSVTGGRIEKGFSGAAVVDDDDTVVGMVVANDRNSGTKIAWLIPLPVVARYHPSLVAPLPSPTADQRPQRVCDVGNPVKLGVHRAADPGDGTVHTGLPPYVRRDVEAELDEAFRAGGLVIIQGPSAAGKSRLAFETMHRLAPDRRLVVPGRKQDWYSRSKPPRDAVVWLDNVEQAIVAGQLTDDTVAELCPEGRGDVVLLATLRAEARNDLRGADGDLTPTAASLLNHHATIISLDRELSPAERAAAEQFRDDPRVADALDQPSGIGFAEHIAAGPAAVDGWRVARQGENVTAGAIVAAAVDARRAGLLSPLPRVLLEELHPLYLGRHLHDPRRPPFSDALMWTLKPVRGATGYLTAEADDRYSPFDYLVDHTQQESPLTSIPAAAWPILYRYAAAADHLFSLATAAYQARHFDLAEAGLREVAEAGGSNAMINLGVLFKETGRTAEAEQWWRRAADVGHGRAPFSLGVLFAETGRMAQAEQWYRRAAATDDTDAMFNLGNLLRQGGRLPEAEQWWRRAADAGHHRATVNLGVLLKQAGRVAEAEQWYRRAADAGVTEAMLGLGVVLADTGRIAEAEQWYGRAAEAGDTNAMFNLGLHLKSTGRVAEAEQWWCRAADAGVTDAMTNLGLLFAETGRTDDAEQWWRRAAEAGYAIAMTNLGNLLHHADRVEEAEGWWRRAADAGHAIAMTNLANLLATSGREAEAERWWRRAADAGNTEAMTNLGVRYGETGRAEEAERWWRRAAEAGNTDGMTNLGVLLRATGRVAEAAQWHRRAADAGNTRAMYNLGVLLADTGRMGEAEHWYRRAADAGNTTAVVNLIVLLRDSGRMADARAEWHRRLQGAAGEES